MPPPAIPTRGLEELAGRRFFHRTSGFLRGEAGSGTTPPAFLAHAIDDSVALRGLAKFFTRLCEPTVSGRVI